MDEARELKILMAGKVFENWIGRPARNLRIAELSVDRARALQELLAEAVNESQPVQTVAHGVVNGSVCAYDLVAMPLSNRWGLHLFLVYMQERERKFSLVEAMFQATTEALSRWPSFATRRGRQANFQIAALNDGAARLMRGTAEEFCGRRLSEMSAALPTRETLSRLISVFNGGGSARFEIDCPRSSGGQTHLSVSVSAIGDLVAMTLTDVSSLKVREESFRLLFRGKSGADVALRQREPRISGRERSRITHYGYE
jgi:hypothetical protein